MSQQSWIAPEDLATLPRVKRHSEWLKRLTRIKEELAEILREGRREGFC